MIAKDYVSIDTAKISEKDLKKRNPINFLNNQWGAHYLTAIEIFKEKPLIGSGIKGFRMQCGKKEYEDIGYTLTLCVDAVFEDADDYALFKITYGTEPYNQLEINSDMEGEFIHG